jgi:hypothetical protein
MCDLVVELSVCEAAVADPCRGGIGIVRRGRKVRGDKGPCHMLEMEGAMLR